MLFAGFNVTKGEYSLIAVTLVGSFANLVGSWIAYGVGYYGRVDILEKHGKKLHIKPSHLHRRRQLFREARRRDGLLHAHDADHPHVHLAAGRRRADAVRRFSILTFLGCLPWVFALTFIGKQVGDNWDGLEGLAALRRLRGRGDHRRRRRLPRDALPPRRRRRRRPSGPASRPPMPPAAESAGSSSSQPRCGSARRSRSGLLHGPAELLPISSSATSRSCRGCWAGPTPTSTASSARPSRSRCTPAPPRRCSSACATRSSELRATSTAAACAARRRQLVPPALAGLAFERPDRAAAGHAAARIATGLAAGAIAMAAADARGAAHRRATTPAPPTRWRSGSRRPARSSRASRATARRSPPRAPAASRARTRASSRAMPRCR